MSAVIPRTKSKGTNVEYTGTDDMPGIDWGDGGREGEREGGRERGRERGREGGREGEREGGRKEGRKRDERERKNIQGYMYVLVYKQTLGN